MKNNNPHKPHMYSLVRSQKNHRFNLDCCPRWRSNLFGRLHGKQKCSLHAIQKWTAVGSGDFQSTRGEWEVLGDWVEHGGARLLGSMLPNKVATGRWLQPWLTDSNSTVHACQKLYYAVPHNFHHTVIQQSGNC